MPWPEALALGLAVVLVAASAVPVAAPGFHDQEPDLWRVQVEVQDWVDLLVLAPLLALTAMKSARGSRVGALVLGGALMYAVYNLVIYAFAVHLNRLFLLYCAALGLAVYALIGHLARLARDDVRSWFGSAPPRRFPAAVLMVLSAVFLLLWSSELVPAVVRGTTPPSLEGTGLLTNPVHALDLSVTLPALFLGGILLWRDRRWGYVLAPMLLTFALVTDLAIVAIIVVSRAQGLPGEIAVAAAIGAAAVVTLGALVALLRAAAGLRPSRVAQARPA